MGSCFFPPTVVNVERNRPVVLCESANTYLPLIRAVVGLKALRLHQSPGCPQPAHLHGFPGLIELPQNNTRQSQNNTTTNTALLTFASLFPSPLPSTPIPEPLLS